MTPERCRAVLVTDAADYRCAHGAKHSGNHHFSNFDGERRAWATWSDHDAGAASLVSIPKPRRLSALLSTVTP